VERSAGGNTQRGEIRTEDIWDRFVERVLSFIDVRALKPLKVVIDAANGMAGVMLRPCSTGCR